MVPQPSESPGGRCSQRTDRGAPGWRGPGTLRTLLIRTPLWSGVRIGQARPICFRGWDTTDGQTRLQERRRLAEAIQRHD
jgi:hypothetical protein